MTLALALALACAPGQSPPPPEPQTTVIAASVPVHHLAQRLGAGQPWTLLLLPPPNADPGSWRPSPGDVARAQAADLILLNGAGYETWAVTAALPATRVVRTARDVPPLRRPARSHSHGPAGDHSHGEVDPHTWSDPGAYARQARAAHAALAALPGADRGALDAALAELTSELAQLEADLRAVSPGPRQPLASNHPSFGHLARRLGLEIVDFDLDPDVAPDAATVAAVTAWAASASGPVLLWEATPARPVTAALPQTLRHLALDPLEHPPESGRYDYGAQAMENVEALRSLAR